MRNVLIQYSLTRTELFPLERFSRPRWLNSKPSRDCPSRSAFTEDEFLETVRVVDTEMKTRGKGQPLEDIT